MSQGVLERYKDLLDLPKHTVPITLKEGSTPLIPVERIAKMLGKGAELFVKFEGLNPTGSFKDRGMVVAVSEAVGRGAKTIICASTGNTAASAAAYAARAGIKAIVLIPEGKVARGKLVASAMYGAQIMQVDGSCDAALQLVLEIVEKLPISLVNSLNPYRLQGQKTAAFEVCDDLGAAPHLLAIPVGNAGNITSYHMGFKQYDALKKTGMPKFLGVQAEGAAPLVIGKIVEKPQTIATAIQIGNPVRREEALAAVRETGGKMMAVSDTEILSAQKLLASEGIWVEPASAAGLAGLLKETQEGRLDLSGKRVVVVCTGHGLKDPDIVDMPVPVKVAPVFDKIAKLLH